MWSAKYGGAYSKKKKNESISTLNPLVVWYDNFKNETKEIKRKI